MKLGGKKQVLFLILVLWSSVALGESIQIDTAYIQKQEEMLVTRLYLSSKFTDFSLKDPDSGLRYRPNSGLNLGVGATYRNMTLNLAFPPGFLNPNREKDWPRYLDLQVHIYPVNWIIDLFGQFYNGYKIRDYYAPGQDYSREDMKVRKMGFHAQYVFAGERISFAAAMQQSEIQKKSAFSTLLGFEAYRVVVKGDSLLLPEDSQFLKNYSRGDFFQFGPNAGLLGTLVFGKGFFLTGVLSGNFSLGYGSYERVKEKKVWGITPSYFFRGFAGYNSKRFSVNLNYVYKRLALSGNSELNQSANTGNYRFNLVYKIPTGKNFRNRFPKFLR